MPWCPKCREEYREGFLVCADCNTELVDNLEPIKNPQIKLCKEVHLMSVPSLNYADVIESLLRAYEVPIRKKYRSAGDYAKVVYGFTNLGVDLYVPDTAYQEAIEIINGQYEDKNNEADELSQLDYDETEYDLWYQRFKLIRLVMVILLLVF